MKIINQSLLLLLLVLLAVASNSLADTSNGVHIIRIDQLGAVHTPQNQIQILHKQRILLPQELAHKLSLGVVKVGLSGQPLHSRTLHISKIQVRGARLVLVGHRLVSQGVNSKGVIPVWLEEVRLTIPGEIVANSWDVLSLQRELERLGIKVKPKPTEVKSVRSISG